MANANTSDFEKVQFEKMINTPVSKLIISLAIPTIISMLVTAIYNMADTFFVSQINTEASAAVGIVFPIMSIIQACGFTLGMGGGSLVSRRLGERNDKEATEISSTAFYTAFAIGLLIAIFGTLFAPFIIRLIGASETVLPYAKDYARYIFLGAPFMCTSFVLNNVLRSEGKAFFSMVALTSGGILNIILDPIFIYTMNLGISGAAIATLISQFISFLILLSWFLRRKTICKISVKYFTHRAKIFFSIWGTGMPSLARQGLASIATILLNTNAAVYGDSAVAAMSIVTKIVMFIASVMIGIGQGFTPVSGYNYGAKRFDRVKKAYWFTVLAGFSVMFVFAAVCFIFAPQIMKFFRNDIDVIQIGKIALRFQVAVLPLHSLIVCTNMLMQSTGQIKSATFLSCNRQGVYFIPLILILPRIFGLFGVEITQAFADFFSVLTAIPYLIWFMRKLNKMQNQQTN